jgi:hypothetical protein
VSETAGRWFKGCALGCGGLIIFGVLAIVGMTFSLRAPFQEAHDDRQILEEHFGVASAFTPPVDGRIAPERVEAFLMVRDALAPIRAEFERVDREVGDFDELGTDEQPTIGEALPAVARLTKTVMGLPWLLGEIERARNRALVEAEMGLGEYAYIYVLAYHDQLTEPASASEMFSGTVLNDRLQDELLEMLRRQHAAAVAIEHPGSDVLVDEIAELERDHDRLPWQDGLPASVAASFEPYRARIDATFSAAAAEFELMNSTVKRGGLTIEMS